MQFLKGLGGLVLLLVLAPACDSTQPTVVGLRGLTIEITSVNALMDTFFLYEIHEDLNSNGMADDGAVGLWCERIEKRTGRVGQLPTPPRIIPDSVPWGYSLEIRILRAGARESVRLSEVFSLTEFANRSPYHPAAPLTGTAIPDIGVCSDDNSIICLDDSECGGTCDASIMEGGKTYVFDDIARVSAANEFIMATVSNPISASNPLMYGFGDGLCSESFPGPVEINGLAPPYVLEYVLRQVGGVETVLPPTVAPQTGDELIMGLEAGDTITVSARRAKFATFSVLTEPVLTARVRVENRVVNVQGSATSGSEQGGGFSFSFTAQ